MGYVLRATASDSDVRIFAAITTDIVEKARQIHGTSPTASAALGRLLTASSMMGTMLKGDKDTLSISLNGGGIAGNLLAASNSTGNVRGYISHPEANLPLNKKGKLDVSGIVGKDGMLNVVKDMGLKEPYSGQVPLYSGEIAEDIAYYFAESEQVPSAVALGVLVDTDTSIKSAGGLIIQMMPDADPLLSDLITYRLRELPPISSLIAVGKSGEDILKMLFDDMNLKVHEKIDTSYVCNCSRDRVENALAALGALEIQDLMKENKPIEIQCHFCNRKYEFSVDELNSILKRQTSKD